jgi:hypothetical protein
MDTNIADDVGEEADSPALTGKQAIDPAARASLISAVALCAILTVLADVFFFGHPVGWTLGGFALAAAVAVIAQNPATLKTRRGLILFAGAIGLSAALVFDPWALPVIMAIVFVATLRMAGTERGGLIETWPGQWAEFAVTGWTRLLADLPIIGNLFVTARPGARSVSIVKSVVLWVIPIVLGLVFVWLFALANPVIEGWIKSLDAYIQIFLSQIADLIPSPPRIVFWAAVFWAAWTLLRFQSRGKAVGSFRKDSNESLNNSKSVGSPELVVRCLIVFNIIFAVQTVLDIRYLGFGAALPEGMTYAEYAHRGAYPLIAASLLSALFVLMAFRAGGDSERGKAARLLVFPWLAQNVFLAVSAGWRLFLYIEVYQLTRMRVAAGIWMLLVAMGLVWIILRVLLLRGDDWLMRVNLIGCMAVLFICSFVNFDTLIANYNVRHCREIQGEGVRLDLGYLDQLGADALPALRWLSAELGADGIGPAASERALWLESDLAVSMSDWQGWTYRKHVMMR